TREQLFVAIRLALATTFERHGISLPMVMDDVLVNFDTRRAYATAKTLLEFSQGGPNGRQIFLFTCHEHICRMFHSLNVPVRVLPSFAAETKHIRIAMPRIKEPPPEETAVVEPDIHEVADEITEKITEEIIEEPESTGIEETVSKRKRRKGKMKSSRARKAKTVKTIEAEETPVQEAEPETVDDSEIDEAEELVREELAVDTAQVPVEESEVETIEEPAEEPNEEPNDESDEWAEHFFDEETNLATNEFADNTFADESSMQDYYEHHNGRVFDADFFDPVEEQELEQETVSEEFETP
ncbi:MAG: hypothetical protein FWD31_14270, partial [Planctomycetaceae bacterium]|nr:hypothetical protein [Planctomycetaceae bacterium]